MEDDTSSKWQAKERRRPHTYIRQSRLQDKKDNERQRGQFIMTKGTFHQGGITLINIYAPNKGAPST